MMLIQGIHSPPSPPPPPTPAPVLFLFFTNASMMVGGEIPVSEGNGLNELTLNIVGQYLLVDDREEEIE